MSMRKSSQNPAPNIAFYYPGHIWSLSDRIKNLILFFDGIGLLVPKYKKSDLEEIDPPMITALQEHNLLHIIEAEVAVDKESTEKLATAMTKIIASGLLDPLTKEKTRFHELSYSRLGGFGDEKLAKAILNQLKAKKLARDSEDGVSIPMHPMVRSLVLVLLAQILRPYGKTMGLELSPATDRPELVDALKELLSIPTTPSSGNVVAFDLETVGVDLASVPIDEVLSFRKDNFEAHRRYALSVRHFVNEISRIPEEERIQAFDERQSELVDLAHDLKRNARKAWKRPASFALSLAGAAWTMKTGDPIGALLAGAAAVLGAEKDKKTELGAYSYVFQAAERYYY